MTVITKKVRLMAAPEPPFVGTTLKVKVEGDDLTFGIGTGTLASGHESISVDWGDGQRESFEKITKATHTYAKAGTYEIGLSDDVGILIVTGLIFPEHAPKIIAVKSNAQSFSYFGDSSFADCANLHEVDVRESTMNNLLGRQFKDCVSLSGELFFPKVARINGSNASAPFCGCTGGITAIHFASVNQATITSSSGFRNDPTLGVPEAEIKFDL